MQYCNSICCPVVDCPVKRYRQGERQRVLSTFENQDAKTIAEDFRLRHSLEPCLFCGKLYGSRCTHTGFNALERHAIRLVLDEVLNRVKQPVPLIIIPRQC